MEKDRYFFSYYILQNSDMSMKKSFLQEITKGTYSLNSSLKMFNWYLQFAIDNTTSCRFKNIKIQSTSSVSI